MKWQQVPTNISRFFLFAFVLLSPQLCSALYSYKIILTGTRQRAKVGFALAVFMLVI